MHPQLDYLHPISTFVIRLPLPNTTKAKPSPCCTPLVSTKTHTLHRVLSRWSRTGDYHTAGHFRNTHKLKPKCVYGYLHPSACHLKPTLASDNQQFHSREGKVGNNAALPASSGHPTKERTAQFRHVETRAYTTTSSYDPLLRKPSSAKRATSYRIRKRRKKQSYDVRVAVTLASKKADTPTPTAAVQKTLSSC